MSIRDNTELIEKRKYVCFICIQDFPDYESYKNHILESHKLNIEYVVCPRCEAPCRDIKSHWRVKHKSQPLPRLKQYTPEKWIDWDVFYGRKNKKTRKYKEGFFDSIKMGKQIHYRSSWERDVMICLEKCIHVSEFYGDDHFCVPYTMNGKPHRYWPDFTVKLTNHDVYILEIKPAEQTQWAINQAKWKAAISYCSQRQWQFQVWTQKYIRKIKTRALRNSVLLAEHVIPAKEEILEGNMPD